MFAISLWNVQKDHVMTAIPGMLHGHQIHIVVWSVLGDNKVVIVWMNGAWEVKGDEHAVPVRGVVDQFVRWFLGGTFRPRTDESDWCRHFDGARRGSGLGAAAWILWLRDGYGSFEKVSHGGRVLRSASAMTAEREALRMGIEYLTV